MDVFEFGKDIKPKITEETAKSLVKKLYDITNFELEKLDGFDDVNYRVRVSENNRQDIWPHGFVMKIINSLDSQETSYIDAQIQMALYLGENGITVPQPVKNCSGKYFSLEDISENGNKISRHVVRMLTYIPGDIIKYANADILFKMGKLVARMDEVLKNFHHPAFHTRKSIWALESFPILREFTSSIEDSKRKKMVNEILDTFDKEVVSIMDKLPKGVIHGDLNDHNIIMKKSEEGNWDVAAFLDLGDTKISCYVFELAVCISYMCLVSPDLLDAGGHVLAGYQTVRSLSETELHILKVCVCARLCQSMVLCAFSYNKYGGNEYKLVTVKRGWPFLELLWNVPNEELIRRWKTIIASYEKSQ